MKFEDFEFIIASPLDREKLVCEMYYKNHLIAEISQETEELIIEIYPQNETFLLMPLVQFQHALEKAKKHLIS